MKWDPAQYLVGGTNERGPSTTWSPGSRQPTRRRRRPRLRAGEPDEVARPALARRYGVRRGQLTGDGGRRGRARHRRAAELRLGDVQTWAPSGPVDVIVTNAVLQWVPGHLDLLVGLVAALAPGGWLALQVPGNFESASHTAIAELRTSPRWRSRSATGRCGRSLSRRPRPTSTGWRPPGATSTCGRPRTSTCWPAMTPSWSGSGGPLCVRCCPRSRPRTPPRSWRSWRRLREAYPRRVRHRPAVPPHLRRRPATLTSHAALRRTYRCYPVATSWPSACRGWGAWPRGGTGRSRRG